LREVSGMLHGKYSSDEVVRRGKALYDRDIRLKVEAGNLGKVLVIDVETGEYEIDEDELNAAKRAKSRHPDGALYMMRIGSSAMYRLGGGFRVT